MLQFESAWKLLWFAAVAVPRAVTGDRDVATRKVVTNCTLVIVVLWASRGDTPGART